MEYGTGAIMAVPGHDERDFEFATQFGLPIVRVVAGEGDDADTPLAEAYTGPGRLVNSGEFDGMAVEEAKRAITQWLAEMGVAGRASTTGCTTGASAASGTGGRRSRSSTATPAAPCRSRRPAPRRPPLSGGLQARRVRRLAAGAPRGMVPDRLPQLRREARRETDVSDTFLDSAWYFLRYPSAGNNEAPLRPGAHEDLAPGDTRTSAATSTRCCTCCIRASSPWSLKDLGHIDFEEPFRSSAPTG
jgi:leucyl-tRNA synthetase